METSIQTFMNTVKVIFEENTTEKVGASVKILTCGRLLYIYPYKRGFVLHYSRQTRPDVCSLLPAPPSSTLSPRNGQLHPSVPRRGSPLPRWPHHCNRNSTIVQPPTQCSSTQSGP
ncbi:uncharacterized protein [Triticum aestivum]|uniref:uncharacterized protein isoform X2 n=1 Tax=Triticum aestivum TaxID=4565 RepID=UPI001D018B3E|nr:uncharacterized protein LOC123110384 isoform X2 [Triticum aestivum]